MGVQPLRLSSCPQRRMPVAVVPFRAAVDEGLQRHGCTRPCPRSPPPGLRLDCICHIGSPNAGDRLPALGLPHSNHGSPAPTVRLDYTKLAEEGSTDRFTTRMQIRIYCLFFQNWTLSTKRKPPWRASTLSTAAIGCKSIRRIYFPNWQSLLPDAVIHISSMLIGSLKSAIQPSRAKSKLPFFLSCRNTFQS